MFEKNFECITNQALKRRLIRITPTESKAGISFCMSASNDYVLLKDDVPSDDLNDPRGAIRKMLKTNIKQEMKPNDIIVTFGIGLCYLLDETFTAYPCKIAVYEPDLAMLHFVLSNVDISEHLSSGRVYITNDLDELLGYLNETYITKDKVEILYLQNYAVVRNKELLLLTQKVYETCKSKMVDISTIEKFSQIWLDNTIKNIAALKDEKAYLLSDLDNKFAGQAALIAGAGPSLNDNIPYIQANRNKFTIFAVNKVVKHLLKNGITPDFVVALDARNMETTLGGLENYLARANCIMDLRTDNAITSKNFRKLFVSFGSTDNIANKIADYNEFMQFNETGGTASTLALISAIRMNFSKIILAGIDLAFKDNVIYASGETLERVSPDEILADGVRKNLVQVDSVNGSKVYTREDYKTFVGHIETLIKESGYNEIYNVSSFGAAINGVKNVKFEDIPLFVPAVEISLDRLSPFKLNVKDFVQDEFSKINQVIELLSRGVFSPALVSSIVKSQLLYQCMQAEIVKILQVNFESELADNFIEKTKSSIKHVVELLQTYKLLD